MNIGKIILTSVLATVTNIFVGIALTPVLVEVKMESLVPSLWMLLMAGIPLEILVALGLVEKLGGD